MTKTIVTIFLFTLFTTSFHAFAENKKEKVIVEYKKYERFDLGNLEIQGSVIAPGDVSVKERERKVLETDFYEKKDYFPDIRRDVLNLK
ncbi:MAG: hypothetical protein A2202_00600 [Bdellovibrionales bacterium RIFOXYA1_FULL_36_14]|nr:MAG: hypothetical protein A2202_00600 [Bdellovibrionales bacterium RIFOXYA1_FULL_36_14]